jgi:hypothetical protein
MMKLFIHLGQGKTGSSAIQSFLNYNRNKLAREYGILYPNFESQYIDQGMYHNHDLFFNSLSENETTQREVEKLLYLKDFCDRNNIKKVIISHESFGLKDRTSAIKLIEKILSCEAVLIVYVRRQDLLIESAWKQWGHKLKDLDNIQQYIDRSDLDLKPIFERYLCHFSVDKFIVRTFEKSSIGADVLLDFLNIIGIQDKQGFVEPPDNNLNKNAGLAPEVVEIMKLCNHLNKGIHHNQIIDFMYSNLSARFKKKDPFKPYGFLSLEERKFIMEKYAQSNREVARLFFKDGREDLFFRTR